MSDPLGPSDPLGLSAERFRKLAHQLVDRVADHWSALDEVAVVKQASLESLDALSGPLPVEPAAGVEELIELLAEHAVVNMQHMSHPRYFARVPGPGSLTGVLGEWLGVGYNAIASSWAGGSGTIQLELVVIRWLAELMGFPAETEGVLVSGGSMGNMAALAVARAAGYGDVVYLSDQTHSSIGRALRMMGFTDEQIRVVPARDRFRWAFVDVQAAIDSDAARAGRATVVATAGTTNTGACDPLEELADLCSRMDLWLHVDGAYGAPAAVTDRGRAAMSGLGRADSLALDPHKWMFQPIDLGVLLVRRPGALERCFDMNPEYLRDVQTSTAGQVDMRNRSPELTRRARAIKLWLTMQAHGTRAIAEAIDRSLSLAEDVERVLREDPRWEIVTPAQLGVITFADKGLSGPEHVERAWAVTESGFASLGCTELAGRTVYRLCLINPLTTLADVQETLERLSRRSSES